VTVGFEGEFILRSDPSWWYVPVDGVQYEPVTLPQRVPAGTEFTVELTATNIGYGPWLVTRPNRWDLRCEKSWRTWFTYHWYDSNGELIIKDGFRTELPHDVQPDEKVNLNMKIKAPSQPGKYRLVIDGVQGQDMWFGPLSGINWPTVEAWIEVIDTSYYKVSYDPVQVPKYMEAGKTYELQVTVTNTGTLTWIPENKVGISHRWHDEYKNPVITQDNVRLYIQHPVPPGNEYTFSLPVTAPSNPGNYVLKLDMVRDNIWFSQKGCPPVSALIKVPQGEVIRGILVYDGANYWIGNTLILPACPDLLQFAGQRVILWGYYVGKIRLRWITSINEYFPGDKTAVITFHPSKDVLGNDPLRGDPDASPGDPVGLPRNDGYAYVRVTFHYPIPIRSFWNWASDKGLWKDAKTPSWSITGEAFLKSSVEGGN
ncbi:hypothetical protein M1N04_00570, partial [Peptococcaceae bacterium]|nr:hypothetical protein [Peptococcaceae bacterium]